MKRKFNEVLKELRKERDLTLKELSKLSGITAAELSKLEGNKHKPSLPTIKKLASVFKCDYEDLFDTVEF